MEPKIAAVIEAAKMDNFASLIKSGSEKANSVIKMDMVKPMPARTEQPNKSDQVMPLPSFAHPVLTISRQVSMMPMGFPKTRPKNTPKLTESGRLAITELSMAIPAEKRAKSGKTI